jgi:hypothetical protein
MSSAQQIIDAARVDLLSGVVEERNRLAASVNESATTVTFTYPLAGVRPGTVFELDTELLYVWAIDNNAQTATVERGWEGTQPLSHASGTVATIKPRFPTGTLFRMLQEEVVSLASPVNGLFRVATLDVQYDGDKREVPLPGAVDLLDVHEVRIKSDTQNWPEVRNWRLQRNQSAVDYGATLSLRLDEDVPAGAMRIIYRASFRSVQSVADDVVAASGMPASCEDIVRLGVQMRALMSRDAKRSYLESQGDTRRPEEVGPQAMAASWRGFAAVRQQRIVEEAAKLQARYPRVIRRK